MIQVPFDISRLWGFGWQDAVAVAPSLCRKFESFEMMTQPFLKPSVSGPLPLHMGKILGAVGAAIRLTLQEDELPVADLVLFVSINTSFGEDLFHQRCNPAQGILRQESNREYLLFQIIHFHGYLHDIFVFTSAAALGNLGEVIGELPFFDDEKAISIRLDQPEVMKSLHKQADSRPRRAYHRGQF